MPNPTPPPDQFRLGEIWLSPRGIRCSVIRIEAHRGEAVLRQENERTRRQWIYQPRRNRLGCPGWTRLEPAPDA